MASIPDAVSTATSWLTFLKSWVAGDDVTAVQDPDGVDRDSPRKQVKALIDAAEADISGQVNGLSIGAFGATADRPSLGSEQRFEYFDDTLGKPVWWTGSDWVDATGTSA